MFYVKLKTTDGFEAIYEAEQYRWNPKGESGRPEFHVELKPNGSGPTSSDCQVTSVRVEPGMRVFVMNQAGTTIDTYWGGRIPDGASDEAASWPELIADQISEVAAEDGRTLCLGQYVRQHDGSIGWALWESGKIEHRLTFHAQEAIEAAAILLSFNNPGCSVRLREASASKLC